ncbi:MAG TPA: RDD family protein [Nitrospira sp.]|nr:RDD family protein [Nitrospira sp.]
MSQVRPWVRYWARMFDIYLACIVAGFAIGILNPDAFSEKGSDQLFGLAVIFAWVFIESLFLSTAGNTPGKWLFKTRIVPPNGGKLDFSTALSRSFKVWWRGLGIGFPLASLITLIVAHGNLTKNSVTTWDRDDGFTVVHERIGVLRVIVAIVFFTGFLLLVVVGSAANA